MRNDNVVISLMTTLSFLEEQQGYTGERSILSGKRLIYQSGRWCMLERKKQAIENRVEK